MKRFFFLITLLLLPSIVHGGATATPTATAIFKNATTLQQLGAGPDSTLLYKGKQIVAGGGGGSVTTQNLTFAAGANMTVTGDDTSKTVTFSVYSSPVFHDVISKGPIVDVRAFMDGASGRPTVAQWQANQTGTDVTLSIQAAIDYATTSANPSVMFPAGTFAYTHITLKSNVKIQGQGMGKTILQALPSDSPYTVILDRGPIVKLALEDLTLRGSGAVGQGCILFEATPRLVSPFDGGLWQSTLRNLYIDNYDGIGMWFKGGYSGSLLPNQFNTLENVNIIITPRVGNRVLKLTGQNAQFNIIGGQFDSGYGNTPTAGTVNIQVSRELTNDDPAFPLGDNAPSFIRFIGATTQGADKGIWFDRASNCEVNVWFENTFRAVTNDTASRGIVVKGSHFANAGSDGAGGGYLVGTGASSTSLVYGNYASGAIDIAWKSLNSGSIVQGANFVVTTPLVKMSSGATLQASIAGDGSITLNQHRTAYVNSSATALKTINTDINVGETVLITAIGGNVILNSADNLHLPAGATNLTLMSGESATFTRVDLSSDLVLTALPRKNSGPTASRPVLQSGESGFVYYDTDLGKDVMWNGAVWKEFAMTGFAESFGTLTVDTAVNSHSAKTVFGDDGTYTPSLKWYRWTGSGSNYYQSTIGNSLGTGGNIDFQTGVSGGALIGSDTQTTRMSITRGGRVLLGPNLPTDDTTSALQVGGSMKPSGDGSACSSTNRGAIRYTAGGTGVADKFEACVKSSANAYAWLAIYTAP